MSLRRRMLLANIKPEQGVLPEGYTECQYISALGRSYINTGLELDNDSEVYIEYMTNDTLSSVQYNTCNLFGYRDSATTNNVTMEVSTTRVNVDFGNYADTRKQISTKLNTNYSLLLNKSHVVAKQDDTLISDLSLKTTANFKTGKAYLFGIGGKPNVTNNFYGRVYKMISKQNGLITRNFVPCYRNSDNKVGMYDLANSRKNLFDYNIALSKEFYDDNGNIQTYPNPSFVNQKIKLKNNVAFSFASKTGNAYIRVSEFRNDGSFIKRTLVNSNTVLQLNSDTDYIYVNVDKTGSNYFADVQIEAGSTITSYEHFPLYSSDTSTEFYHS